MSAPPGPPNLDTLTTRALAAGLFNRTWELLGLDRRTEIQNDELIHTAHASRYHWAMAAPREPVRLARGEWLCSRVYATLGRGEPALWHATRCRDLLEPLDVGDPESGGREDWDLAAAYEAVARAYAVAGDAAASGEWAARCRDALASIADADDREVIENDLRSIEGPAHERG